jgi:N-acetylneuraminic acid mutarotase
MKAKLWPVFVVVSIIAIALTANGCGSSARSTPVTPSALGAKMWTWVSGSNIVLQTGNYGKQGISASSNVPGAREWAVSWTDSQGNFWLFGGFIYDSTSGEGCLNDLWEYDGTNWTWISGSNTKDQTGNYGKLGTPASSNVPGARGESLSWIDAGGNLWLFGGIGYDSTGNDGYLNDLWKYDVKNNTWTWVSGSNTILQIGHYGKQGTAASSNVPGARFAGESGSWIDSQGNLWLFGGSGVDSVGTQGLLNDLWKYDVTNNTWTWVSGSSTASQLGNYGNQGTPSSSNIPGARYGAVSWIDSHDNLWLFGGFGYDSAGSGGCLNDLWKYDGTNNTWTWVSGSSTASQLGNYGNQGTPSSSNIPGAREGAVSWIDSAGNFWLFGGAFYDYSVSSYLVSLNDLWKYDGANWTWVSGSSGLNQLGSYGTLGTPGSSNVPGARYGAVSWMDSAGNLWLFGGGYWNDSNTLVYFNDLWKYIP